MKPTPKAFPAQFKTFTLLHKIAALVRRFKVTHRQLAWLCDYGPSMGWLDLAVLPAAPGDPPAPFADWLRLVDLFQLRDGLPPITGIRSYSARDRRARIPENAIATGCESCGMR